MGSPAAIVAIALGAIADHRVKRVDHLIGQHAGHAQQGEPEERGYHAVAQVLGQRLKGCGAHFLSRQLGGVAPNDASHLPTPFV